MPACYDCGCHIDGGELRRQEVLVGRTELRAWYSFLIGTSGFGLD
jgi:hypothetical protein